METIAAILLFFLPAHFANSAPFAAESDLVADLSDGVLNGIYRHPLSFCELSCEVCEPSCEKGIWLEGFGSYRNRNKATDRSKYSNGLGGILAGFDYEVSCNSALNFFIGGSWGKIDIHKETCFDTNSILFGMTIEKICGNQFFGAAFATGILSKRRFFNGVREKVEGVFLTPEVTYACQFEICNTCPIFTSTLRYAGFFPGDYQHREFFGTLYIRDRSIQLFTLREELAIPICPESFFYPYIGVAGRFQFAGDRVRSRVVLDELNYSNGIKNSLAYGFLGIRGFKECGCFDILANFEGSYDSEKSWRVLGELSFNYAY